MPTIDRREDLGLEIDFKQIEKSVFDSFQSDQKRGITDYSEIQREIITLATKAAIRVVQEYHKNLESQ